MLKIELGQSPNTESFELNESFTLGVPARTGILRASSFTTTTPPISFKATGFGNSSNI